MVISFFTLFFVEEKLTRHEKDNGQHEHHHEKLDDSGKTSKSVKSCSKNFLN